MASWGRPPARPAVDGTAGDPSHSQRPPNKLLNRYTVALIVAHHGVTGRRRRRLRYRTDTGRHCLRPLSQSTSICLLPAWGRPRPRPPVDGTAGASSQSQRPPNKLLNRYTVALIVAHHAVTGRRQIRYRTYIRHHCLRPLSQCTSICLLPAWGRPPPGPAVDGTAGASSHSQRPPNKRCIP
jgi:hypothetical protein